MTGPATKPPARVLGLGDLFALGTNAIIGSGVFALPDDLTRSMGVYSPLVYLFCGILLLPVALCFAELSTRDSRNGGPYTYALDAFGPHTAFVVGWSSLINAMLSWSASTSLFVDLCGIENAYTRALAAVSAVLMLSMLNALGAKLSSRTIGVLTAAKLLAIGAFIVAALFARGRSGGHSMPSPSHLGHATLLAVFPLQGFEAVPVPAGESKRPSRDIAIATVGSLLLAIVVYVVVQFLFNHVATNPTRESDTPLVDAARSMSPTLGSLVFIGSLVSIAGFCAGSAFGSPRFLQAMAAERQLPKAFANLHARFGTPTLAIGVCTLAAAAFSVTLTYSSLVAFSNITVILQYVIACLAVVALRKRRTSSAWSVPVPLALVGAITSASLLLFAERFEFLAAGTLLASGLVLSLVMKRRREGV